MPLQFLRQIFEDHRSNTALIHRDRPFTYDWLLGRIDLWRDQLTSHGVDAGRVVVIESDFSPDAVALLLSLIETGGIAIPITPVVRGKREEYLQIANPDRVVTLQNTAPPQWDELTPGIPNQLYDHLREVQHPGLVLFSSGSTGQSKAVVHDFTLLLKKFIRPGKNLRTLPFLLFDHIGGIDTLFYALSNASCLVIVEDRSPDAVCAAIERHRVEVLPASPTFLNLLLLSESYKHHDLSSLKYITYGTEVMPAATLERCATLFPDVRILQKYGTSEVGTLRSQSRGSDSVWVRIGGEGYRTRVVDGILQIKAESAMLGYLNAPSPFTNDGWFVTGDVVEQDGDYLRIMGRESDIINVGGRKVYPAEVEAVLQQMDNVAEALVFGQTSPLIGQMVCARLTLLQPEPLQALTARVRLFCRERLEPYKVPSKVDIADGPQHTDRFKKVGRRE